jgi:hypothetical protein
MVVMAIAELVLLGLVNGFGPDATAAYGAVLQFGYYMLVWRRRPLRRMV